METVITVSFLCVPFFAAYLAGLIETGDWVWPFQSSFDSQEMSLLLIVAVVMAPIIGITLIIRLF